MMDPLQLPKSKEMESKKTGIQSKNSYQFFLIYLGQKTQVVDNLSKRLQELSCGSELFLFDGRRQIPGT